MPDLYFKVVDPKLQVADLQASNEYGRTLPLLNTRCETYRRYLCDDTSIAKVTILIDKKHIVIY